MRLIHIRRPFLLIYLPYLTILTLGFINFIAFDYLRFYEIIKNNEHLQVDMAGKWLARDFQRMLPDIEVLSNEQHVQQYIEDFSPHSRRLLERELASFARQKRDYRAIRLIDITGMERIRIDYNRGMVDIRTDRELQNRSDENYFMQGVRPGKKKPHISPIQLNRTDGNIEIPHVPIIRIAMPVYDSHNTRNGIIVLDYNANNMLEHFDEMLAGSYGHIALVNHDGYWIRSHKPEREWGFHFNENMRFDQHHPIEWQLISRQHRGQIRTDEGLFTFTSIDPIRLIGGYTTNSGISPRADQEHIDPESHTWKIISDVPSAITNHKLKQHILGLDGLIWLTLALFGLFASRHLALNYVERRKLRNQLELHSQIYHSSTDGVIITDDRQNILDVNEAFLDICGYSMDEIKGNKPSMFSSGHHESEFYRNMWRQLQQEGRWEGEICNRHKSGSVYIEWIRITAVRDENGDFINYIALVSDITQRKSTEEQLLKHAHHDALTDAHNRLSFDEIFHHELLVAKRNQRKLAVLYFDLDSFKPVNDTYGHQAGDLVLQTVVNRIYSNIRDTDTLARLGGDEFGAILPDITSREDADKVANTLRYLIREPINYQGTTLFIDTSVGVAVYPDDGTDEKELINVADARMFENKAGDTQDAKAATNNP